MARARTQGNSNALLKVIILGDGRVGKSCLINRFVNNHFDENTLHTIGVEFLNKEMKIKNELYTLQIWDTAGQERFKSLRTPFYRGADICMLMFSIDDPASFKNLANWRKEFFYYADIQDEDTFPFIVVGNKVDMKDKRKVGEEEAKNWCKAIGGIPYVETSAKDAFQVDEAFNLAVDLWSQLEADLDKQGIYHSNTVKIKRPQQVQEETCCGIK